MRHSNRRKRSSPDSVHSSSLEPVVKLSKCLPSATSQDDAASKDSDTSETSVRISQRKRVIIN